MIFSQGFTSDLVQLDLIFYTLLSHIKKSQSSTEFKSRSLSEKYLALKLKITTMLFGTASLNFKEQSILNPKLFFITHFEKNK
jgi:hypothetical protein